jgi:hypothetical protein
VLFPVSKAAPEGDRTTELDRVPDLSALSGEGADKARLLSPDQIWRALRVDNPVQLSMPFKNAEVTVYSRILGFRRDRFLLVEQPVHEGVSLGVTGVTAIVRFVTAGCVIGFGAQVIRSQFMPEPLMFLSYPDAAKEMILRKHDRMRVSLPCVVRPASSDLRLLATLHDLSPDGAGLLLPEGSPAVENGTQVAIHVQLPGSPGAKRLRGTVRVVRQKRRRSGHSTVFLGVKLQFGPTEVDVQQLIQRIVTARETFSATADLDP